MSEEIVGDVLGGVASGATGLMDIMFYIIIGVGLSLLVFFLIYVMQFKHKVRLKKITNNRKIVMDFRCREFTDKDKTTWLQLLTTKKEYKLLPVPNSDAIEIDDKGKLVYEGYVGSHGQITWSKDIAQMKDLPKDIQEIKDQKEKKEAIDIWSRKENAIVGTQPFTSTERAIAVNRVIKAQERKKSDWKENLPMIASLGAIVILVVCLMVFWGDIAKPAIEGKELTRETIQIQKETIQILQDIKTNTQTIQTEQNKPEK